MVRRGFGLMLAIAAVAASPAQAQSPKVQQPAVTRSIIVNPDAIRCLLTKLDRVPAEARGVFVEFGDCQKSGVRVIRHLYAPTPRRDPGVETILFVRPHQLSCMRRHRRNADRILEALPDGRHRLKIDPCGR
jgi:hypothetical protein